MVSFLITRYKYLLTNELLCRKDHWELQLLGSSGFLKGSQLFTRGRRRSSPRRTRPGKSWSRHWDSYCDCRYHLHPPWGRMFQSVALGLDRRGGPDCSRPPVWNRDPGHGRLQCNYRDYYRGNYSVLPVPATGQGLFRKGLKFPFFISSLRELPVIRCNPPEFSSHRSGNRHSLIKTRIG